MKIPMIIGTLLVLISPFAGWAMFALSHIEPLAVITGVVFGVVGVVIAFTSYLNGID